MSDQNEPCSCDESLRLRARVTELERLVKNWQRIADKHDKRAEKAEARVAELEKQASERLFFAEMHCENAVDPPAGCH